jgi:hypothetical protein
MGMTYEELGLYGRLRKITRCGPVAMFRQACQVWREVHTPQQVADKVRPRGCVCAAELQQGKAGEGAVWVVDMCSAQQVADKVRRGKGGGVCAAAQAEQGWLGAKGVAAQQHAGAVSKQSAQLGRSRGATRLWSIEERSVGGRTWCVLQQGRCCRAQQGQHAPSVRGLTLTRALSTVLQAADMKKSLCE